MMHDLAVYGTLFWNAFLAATILPALSEFALAAFLKSGNGHPLLLLLFATAGNVIGSIVNWWLGHKITKFENRKWFPFTPDKIEKASLHFRKYGIWSLLFAWLPIVGDPLTLIAGVLRVPFLPFLLLVTLGKTLRYSIIVIIVL
ncbi:YqaA family protein [Kordiimonas aquimaris]|uniref:YqaA family protein n=1 Tax=Kordiimonas aquimaris TaxID=707591 RepID=UPI0021CEAE2A|nr:YqaA family protein [Kordiimonas aquimaris]